MSSEKGFVSPLAKHKEQASLFSWPKPKPVGATPTGKEIACIVGGINEEPIEALFHAASRTVYPVRKQ